MSSEVWKDIVGYEGLYQVSSLGRVRSLERWVDTNSGTRFYQSRILRAEGVNGKKYPRVGLSRVGVVIPSRVHVLVLEAFVGPCPNGMECRHLDGDWTNNRLENLCWGTSVENKADMAIHGTGNQGERNHFSKMSEDSVREMKRLSGLGWKRPRIARFLNISYTIVSDVLAGRTWRHLCGS